MTGILKRYFSILNCQIYFEVTLNNDLNKYYVEKLQRNRVPCFFRKLFLESYEILNFRKFKKNSFFREMGP